MSPADEISPGGKPAAERIDKWLWFARFGKTRAVAQKLVTRGQVSINGRTVKKTSAAVRIGDKIGVILGAVKRNVTVCALGERRGPADEARRLYDEPAPLERLSSEHAALPVYKPMAIRDKGSGRPTKKDRRAITHAFAADWDVDD